MDRKSYPKNLLENQGAPDPRTAAWSLEAIPEVLRLSACAWLGAELAYRLASSSLGASAFAHSTGLAVTGLLAALVVLGLATGRSWLAYILAGSLLVVVGGGGLTGSRSTGGIELDGNQLVQGVPVTARIADCGSWRLREFSTVARCWMRSYRWQGRVVVTAVEVKVSLPRDSQASLGCGRIKGILRQPVAPRNQQHRSQAPRLLTLTVKSTRLVAAEVCGPARDRWRAMSRAVRTRIRAALFVDAAENELDATLPSFGRRLAAAMWLGEPTYISPRVRVGLANWGLTHLLAVSGLHVGILLGLGLLSLQRLLYLFPRYSVGTQCAWVLLCGGCVLLAVGPRVSVTRALGMAVMALLALWWRRPSGSLGALGGALAVVLLLSPEVVQTVAFRLSFAATLGVLVGAPRLVRSWRRLPRVLAVPLAVSVAAQLATLPWALGIYPVIPLAAPLVNLVAIPVAVVVLVLGLTAVGLDVAGLSFGVLEPLLEISGEVFLCLTEVEPTRWLQPSWSWHPMWSLVFAAIYFLWISRPLQRSALVLVLMAFLWWPASRASKISFLDVGQGDAIFLKSGKNGLLIDGGGWRGGQVAARVLLPVLASERIKKLRAVVLSHGDLDHCGGLLELSWMIRIDELWMGPGPHEGSCVDALMGRFTGRIRYLESGDRRELGDWTLRVLADGVGARTQNGRSLVLVAEQGAYAALLTGDIERTEEEALVEQRGDPQEALKESLASVDVLWLKVAHHGSRTSTSARFLDAIGPSVAVISAGTRNPYGHPSKQVLDRLKRKGIKVLRTDILGRIDYCPPDVRRQQQSSF